MSQRKPKPKRRTSRTCDWGRYIYTHADTGARYPIDPLPCPRLPVAFVESIRSGWLGYCRKHADLLVDNGILTNL